MAKNSTPDHQTIWQATSDNLNALAKHHLFAHKIGNIRASGDFTESGFRSLLRQILPERFYITSGHIWNGETKKISSQCDIIIADSLVVHSLMLSENADVQFDIVPIEAVVGVFEVKSKLNFKSKDSQSIQKALHHLKTVKDEIGLQKSNPLRILPAGFVVSDLAGGFYTNPILGILSAECSNHFNDPEKVSSIKQLYDDAQIDIVLSSKGFLLTPISPQGNFLIDESGHRFKQANNHHGYIFTENNAPNTFIAGIGIILDYLCRTAGRNITSVQNYFFPSSQTTQKFFKTLRRN